MKKLLWSYESNLISEHSTMMSWRWKIACLNNPHPNRTKFNKKKNKQKSKIDKSP